ncbi:hypothetical protein CBS101457_000834 [Exobasidium rhododendri]|nr:hypothetical protein CBS101457_000834 [Exobasidium rhododendri]
MTAANTPPYLSLTVSQAAALSPPDSPEPLNHHTFTSLIDHRAKYQSSQLAVGFPHRRGEKCVTFTYGQLAAISTRVAEKIKTALKGHYNAARQPIIAFLGPSGSDFLLNVMACWRVGAAILPIALGTSAKGAALLLKAGKCDVLLYANNQTELVEEIMSSEASSLLLAEWFDCKQDQNASDDSAFEPLYRAGPSDILVIFHSSGSSGAPKPIPQLHKAWSASLITAPGRRSAAFTTTPLFHGGLSDLFRAFQASATIYFYPWHLQLAPTIEHVVDSVECCDQEIKYFLSVPFILEMLIKDAEGGKMLQKMDLVSTGGAPLDEAVGGVAVREKNIKLVSRLGSSECGFLMSSFRDFESDKDWSWLRLDDKLGRSWLRFEPDADPGNKTYELIVSSQWPTKELSNRPDGSFATGDLYERHPTHSNRWRYKRRGDDSIVMVNGKKVSGSLLESSFCASPLIDEAIVFGSNRPLLGAFVFPSDAGEISRLKQELKLFLKDMNRNLPSHARIPLEMINFSDSNLRQSLPRSSKGTLQKGLALEKLQPLIDDTYTRFQEGEADSSEEKVQLNGETLKRWLTDLINDISEEEIGLDDDFYQSGIDSIMAARIRAGVHQGLSLGGLRLRPNDIYEYPTINLLAAFIESRGGNGQEKGRVEVMLDMVKKYSNHAKGKARDDSQGANGPTTVLLTGATGALGSRILYHLLQDNPSIDKVVCLVRAQDSLAARERVKSALKDRGLQVPDEKKIDCVTQLWELGLKKSVTGAANLFVIHSAWIVNFNLRIESFEQECIAGLKDLLDFFLSCSNACKFIFCSSIASIMNGRSPHREMASESTTDSGNTGYGNSKWVAEKICHQAGSKVLIARIGQLCGDTVHGIWNTSEAWPLMIRTAQEVGLLPNSGPDVDWLPVDVAAKGIIEICLTSESRNEKYYHVALPPKVKRPSWNTFVQWLQGSGLDFNLVKKEKWLEAVQQKKDQVRGSALIDIWTGIPGSNESEDVLEMDQAMACSASLSSVKAVDQELCQKMVDAWKFSGFLS